ncbi:hypothetical protein LINGRAHAP2_LOCUS13803 [Linum grandiflorum]
MFRVLSKSWRPGRGVEINELEGRMYLFQCNHILDVRRIIDGGPWSFDDHMLLTHELQQGETPKHVSINRMAFWVQVHQLPHRYFSEAAGRAIGDNIGVFQNYDERNATFLLDASCESGLFLMSVLPLL